MLLISRMQLLSQSKRLFNKWKASVHRLLLLGKLKGFRKKYKFVDSVTFDLNHYTNRKNILIDYFFKWKYSPLNLYCAYIINRKIKRVIVKPIMIRDYSTIRGYLLRNSFTKWKIEAKIELNNTRQKSSLPSFKQIELLTLAKNFYLIKVHSKLDELNDKGRRENQMNNLKLKDRLMYKVFLRKITQRIDTLRDKFAVWSRKKGLNRNKCKANKKSQSALFIVQSIKGIRRKQTQKYFFKWIEASLLPMKEHILLNTIISYKETKDNIIKGSNSLCSLILRRKLIHWRLVSEAIEKILRSSIQMIKRHCSRFLIQSLKRNKEYNILSDYCDLWKQDMVYHRIRGSLIHFKRTELLLKAIMRIYYNGHLSLFLVKWYHIQAQLSLREIKLKQCLMKNDRLLLIEHVLTMWKRNSFRIKKRRYPYLHLIRSLTNYQKGATKTQRSLRFFFDQVRSLNKRNKMTSFIHLLKKTLRLKAMKKLKYYSFKTTLVKATGILQERILKYPLGVLRNYVKSLEDKNKEKEKELNQDLSNTKKKMKNSLSIETVSELKDKMSKAEIKEDSPHKTTKKIKQKKIIKKNDTKDTKLVKRPSNANNTTAFDEYHNTFSLVSPKNKPSEEKATESNQLNDLLKTKQLKTFNYDILSSAEVVDKTTNVRASETLKSYTDYLSQLSNQLDNYQQSNQPSKAEVKATTTASKAPALIKKTIKKSSKEPNLASLFKRYPSIAAHKKYLRNLSNAAGVFKKMSNLCYLVKITFLHNNYKKMSTLKTLISKWKYITLKVKVTTKTNAIVYNNMNKLHQQDTQEILGNNKSSYQSQIKKSLHNFALYPIVEDKAESVSLNKEPLVLNKKKK